MAPPEEILLTVVIAELAATLCTEDESVKAGAVRKVPDVITRLVPVLLTATNKPLPYVTENQFWAGTEREVQLIPSVLVIGTETPTATNKPLPYVTEIQG